MLIDKPIKKNDIVTIKLTTGEELIACYFSDSDKDLVVEKPGSLARTPQGEMGIVPWMMSANTAKVSLNRNTVIAMARTDDDLSRAYTEATSSIQLAQ